MATVGEYQRCRGMGNCSCPRCYDRERYEYMRMREEMEYRIRREVDYRLTEIRYRLTEIRYRLTEVRYQTMPQLRIGIDTGTTDETAVTAVWQVNPWEPMQINPEFQQMIMDKWDTNATKQLISGDEPEKASKNMGNVVKRIKALGLSKEDKLLRKYQIVDASGDLTADGKEALWSILLTENKSALVEKLTELEADEKKKR